MQMLLVLLALPWLLVLLPTIVLFPFFELTTGSGPYVVAIWIVGMIVLELACRWNARRQRRRGP